MNDSLRNTSIILVQGSTIFVALSIVLGRIYFLTYYKTLGIPVSEISLSTIDYSVISPDVTVFGIGLSAFIGFSLWARRLLLLSATFQWRMILWAVAFVVAGFLVGLLDDVLLRVPSQNLVVPGMTGLLKLLLVAFSATAGILLVIGIGRGKDTSSSGYSTPNVIVVYLVIIMTGFLVILQVLTISSQLARIDATLALQSAPEATVELRSPTSTYLTHTGNGQASDCSENLDICSFRVILIADRFVYLQPIDSESSPGKRSLSAIAVDDISRIVYLSEGR